MYNAELKLRPKIVSSSEAAFPDSFVEFFPVFFLPSHQSSLVVFRSLVKFRLYNSRGNCGKVLVELGLNEQVPKVEKKSICGYFKLSIFSK